MKEGKQRGKKQEAAQWRRLIGVYTAATSAHLVGPWPGLEGPLVGLGGLDWGEAMEGGRAGLEEGGGGLEGLLSLPGGIDMGLGGFDRVVGLMSPVSAALRRTTLGEWSVQRGRKIRPS